MAFRRGPVYDAAVTGSEVAVEQAIKDGVYGTLPAGLDEAPAGAVQLSPLKPGAERFEDCAPASLQSLVMLAPPGTVERRYALALGLRSLAPGGLLRAMAPKLKGGARLGDELRRFGCTVEETAKRHHRICAVARPSDLDGIEAAVAAGGPRLVETLGLWSQPGLFSWDRLDPGSALLIEHLPPLFGTGADFGCGIGVLGRAVLASPKVKQITMIDTDRRALDAAGRNVADPRAILRWADLQGGAPGLKGLDFVVMNPPFHLGSGTEDQGLGLLFISRAAESLRPGGVLWLTANRHLPYEAALKPAFKTVTARADRNGFKIIEARR